MPSTNFAIDSSNRHSIFCLFAFRFMRSIATGMIAIVFPFLVLQKDHWSIWHLSLIYIFSILVSAGIGYGASLYAHVHGEKKALFLFSGLFPISTAFLLINAPWAVLVAAILGGYSSTGSRVGTQIGGILQPVQRSALSKLIPANARTIWFSIFPFLGGIFSALGVLLSNLFSIQEVIFIATLISILSLGWIGAIHIPQSSSVPESISSTTSKKNIQKFSITMAINGFTQGLLSPFLIPFFIIVFHIPRVQISYYSSCGAILGSVSLLSAPWIEKKLGFLSSIFIFRGCGTLLLTILPFCHWVVLALIIFIISPSLRILTVPIQQSTFSQLVDAHQLNLAFGTSFLYRRLASASALGVSGYLFNHLDFNWPFLIYGSCMASNLMLYYLFFKKNNKIKI